MIERITQIQQKIIDRLFDLVDNTNEKEYFVKAPTGSGKTYMQGYLINQLIKKYPDCKIIYQSLSKGALAKQGYDSITKYNFQNINPYYLNTEISDQESLVIPTNYNVYFLPKDLNKEKGLIKQPLKDFLTYKTRDCVKFLIIDECHEAHNNIDKFKNEFHKIIGFSATPTEQQLLTRRCIELSEEECIDNELIKWKKIIHMDDPVYPSNPNEGNLLKWTEQKVIQSLEDFKKIKEDYKDTGVNPALIIQISNKTKGQKQKEKIIEILNKQGYLWYYRDDKGFESSDKINELKGANKIKAWNYVKSNSSTIDVIIFKLTINVGVDIPRACYLLQIRETQSETLDEQVIGRIRRNPKLSEWDSLPKEKKDKLLIAYVNGVEQQETREVFGVKRIKNISIKTTVLKSKKPNKFRKIDELDLIKGDREPQDIFKLKELWDKLDGRIKCESKNLTKEKWIEYCLNVETINKESFIEDYNDNVIINDSNVSLQEETFYRKEKYITDIEKWNWININKSTEYHFESDAEKNIAKELNKLNLELWGKNWYTGSKIKFEYFLKSKGNLLISNQHPDFYVVKNKKIYLIEVKSYLKSGSNHLINEDEYENKVLSIQNVYKEIAKVTGQTMVLIIERNNGDWISHVYKSNGEEEKLYNDDKFNFLNN